MQSLVITISMMPRGSSAVRKLASAAISTRRSGMACNDRPP
jgi:hypothetical protein